MFFKSGQGEVRVKGTKGCGNSASGNGYSAEREMSCVSKVRKRTDEEDEDGKKEEEESFAEPVAPPLPLAGARPSPPDRCQVELGGDTCCCCCCAHFKLHFKSLFLGGGDGCGDGFVVSSSKRRSSWRPWCTRRVRATACAGARGSTRARSSQACCWRCATTRASSTFLFPKFLLFVCCCCWEKKGTRNHKQRGKKEANKQSW